MPFQYDPASRRYRDSDGRYLPASTVRAAVDTVVASSGQTLRDLTSQLRDGTLSIPMWQQQVAAEVKSLHLATAAASRGGWASMTPSDFGWTGQRLRTQYAYLRGCATDIASGQQSLNGTLEARAALYAEAARSTAREMERRMGAETGMEQERNQLGASDHCPGCLSATSRGWVTIGTLPAVGNRDCRSRCRCVIVTRQQA